MASRFGQFCGHVSCPYFDFCFLGKTLERVWAINCHRQRAYSILGIMVAIPEYAATERSTDPAFDLVLPLSAICATWFVLDQVVGGPTTKIVY